MSYHILVTGANGFVGKNFVQSLYAVKNGKDKVHIWDNLTAPSELEIFEYDIDSTEEQLNEYCKKADFVFNFAGVNRPQNNELLLEKMITQVRLVYPNLNISGYEPSIFRELSDDEVQELCRRINAVNSDFVWVAIGAPRQELLMNRMKGKVNSIMTGVGGAFNILAGVVNDAPMWMQNAGLEWFYRFIKEPKRLFKRYFVTNTKFIYYLLKTKDNGANK